MKNDHYTLCIVDQSDDGVMEPKELMAGQPIPEVGDYVSCEGIERRVVSRTFDYEGDQAALTVAIKVGRAGE